MTSMYNPSVYQPRGIEPSRVIAQVKRRKDGSVVVDPKTRLPVYRPFVFDVDEADRRAKVAAERERERADARSARRYNAQIVEALTTKRDERRLREYELRVRANDLERAGLVLEAREARRLADEASSLSVDEFTRRARTIEV